MCEPRPGTRCARDTRTAAEKAMSAYHDQHPDGPSVHPLNSAVSRVCDLGEMRLVSDSSGALAFEHLEYAFEEECWFPGPNVSASESPDLGAWFSDPRKYTSEHTQHTRNWDPVWNNGELVVTHHRGAFAVSFYDGEETRLISTLTEHQADRLSEWLLRTPRTLDEKGRVVTASV